MAAISGAAKAAKYVWMGFCAILALGSIVRLGKALHNWRSALPEKRKEHLYTILSALCELGSICIGAGVIRWGNPAALQTVKKALQFGNAFFRGTEKIQHKINQNEKVTWKDYAQFGAVALPLIGDVCADMLVAKYSLKENQATIHNAINGVIDFCNYLLTPSVKKENPDNDPPNLQDVGNQLGANLEQVGEQHQAEYPEDAEDLAAILARERDPVSIERKRRTILLNILEKLYDFDLYLHYNDENKFLFFSTLSPANIPNGFEDRMPYKCECCDCIVLHPIKDPAHSGEDIIVYEEKCVRNPASSQRFAALSHQRVDVAMQNTIFSVLKVAFDREIDKLKSMKTLIFDLLRHNEMMGLIAQINANGSQNANASSSSSSSSASSASASFASSASTSSASAAAAPSDSSSSSSASSSSASFASSASTSSASSAAAHSDSSPSPSASNNLLQEKSIESILLYLLKKSNIFSDGDRIRALLLKISQSFVSGIAIRDMSPRDLLQNIIQKARRIEAAVSMLSSPLEEGPSFSNISSASSSVSSTSSSSSASAPSVQMETFQKDILTKLSDIVKLSLRLSSYLTNESFSARFTVSSKYLLTFFLDLLSKMEANFLITTQSFFSYSFINSNLQNISQALREVKARILSLVLNNFHSIFALKDIANILRQIEAQISIMSAPVPSSPQLPFSSIVSFLEGTLETLDSISLHMSNFVTERPLRIESTSPSEEICEATENIRKQMALLSLESSPLINARMVNLRQLVITDILRTAEMIKAQTSILSLSQLPSGDSQSFQKASLTRIFDDLQGIAERIITLSPSSSSSSSSSSPSSPSPQDVIENIFERLRRIEVHLIVFSSTSTSRPRPPGLFDENLSAALSSSSSFPSGSVSCSSTSAYASCDSASSLAGVVNVCSSAAPSSSYSFSSGSVSGSSSSSSASCDSASSARVPVSSGSEQPVASSAFSSRSISSSSSKQPPISGLASSSERLSALSASAAPISSSIRHLQSSSSNNLEEDSTFSADGLAPNLVSHYPIGVPFNTSPQFQ